MKLIKPIVLFLTIVLLIACTEKKGTKATEQISNSQENIQNNDGDYLESISSIDSNINLLQSSKEVQTQEIGALTTKRDSLQRLLKQIENSLSEIKNKKIVPGIDGVNEKLNELKGQKENLEELLALQKQEVGLIQKKNELLIEEKNVYTAQKQAIWDKGAPPENFIVVDSLLSQINQRFSEQKARLKKLNRNVSDIEEQIVSINDQRTSLSTKIRNNYTAKEIFEGYSKEETEKLANEIKTIDEQLKVYLDKDSELANELALKAGEKAKIESKQGSLLEEAKAKEAETLKQKFEVKKSKKKSRITFALISISVLALLMITLYLIGKKRKSKKRK